MPTQARLSKERLSEIKAQLAEVRATIAGPAPDPSLTRQLLGQLDLLMAEVLAPEVASELWAEPVRMES